MVILFYINVPNSRDSAMLEFGGGGGWRAASSAHNSGSVVICCGFVSSEVINR